jgi:hypothetical protein
MGLIALIVILVVFGYLLGDALVARKKDGSDDHWKD